MKRFGLGLIVMLVLAVVTTSVFASGETEGRAGRAELRFLEGMIDHHQMALDMAADCLENATAEEVRTICQNVIDAQSAEIALMQGWLLEWYNVAYAPMPMYSMMEMMETMPMGGSMGGMDLGGHGGHGGAASSEGPFTDPAMMMGMFAGFNRLEGEAYDVAWLESMIDHHDDALHMSERLLERLGDGGHAEVRELAQAIVNAQTAEIAEMEALLETFAA